MRIKPAFIIPPFDNTPLHSTSWGRSAAWALIFLFLTSLYFWQISKRAESISANKRSFPPMWLRCVDVWKKTPKEDGPKIKFLSRHVRDYANPFSQRSAQLFFLLAMIISLGFEMCCRPPLASLTDTHFCGLLERLWRGKSYQQWWNTVQTPIEYTVSGLGITTSI